MQRRWMSGRSGTEWGHERRRFGVGVFRQISDQVWSRAMTERQVEYGIKIGVLRIAVSWTRRVWTDGKMPASELVS